jgi:hypothetical protein
VLWGDGVLWGDSVESGGDPILAASGSTGQILSTTSPSWYPAFADPTSMGTANADSVLMLGISDSTTQKGTPGSWYYPPLQ